MTPETSNNEQNREESPVLRFQNVRVEPNLDDPSAPGFDLDLFPGEMAVFCCDDQDQLPDVANLATGLVQPSQGQVFFRGQCWTEMEGPDLLAARSEVGRVFSPRHGASWVQNLDVDENVMVAHFFRPDLTAAAVLERTSRVMEQLSLKNLPRGRPAVTADEDLTRAQWVRAFLPQPLRLLILERPGFGLIPEQLAPLVRQVGRVREEGAAVLWIDFHDDALKSANIEPTHEFSQLPEALSDSS